MATKLRLYASSQVQDQVDLNDVDAVEALGRIIVNVPGSPHEWHLTGPDGRSISLLSKPMCSVGDPTVALGVLRSGAGVAFLPAAFGEPRVLSGDFVHALPKFAGPSVEIFASFPPRRASVPAVRAFLDVLLEAGKEMPH